MNNRSRAFTDEKDALCNKDNKYDIVIGPVADDNMALLFRQYEHEIIDLFKDEMNFGHIIQAEI